jgi:hypothetical protein
MVFSPALAAALASTAYTQQHWLQHWLPLPTLSSTGSTGFHCLHSAALASTAYTQQHWLQHHGRKTPDELALAPQPTLSSTAVVAALAAFF